MALNSVVAPLIVKKVSDLATYIKEEVRFMQNTQLMNLVFLLLTHVMRRPCWCLKQWQNVAQVLHNNEIKFPKDFFRYCSVHYHGRRDVS